jgi:predicted ATPase/class 3 adenylate cyclase
LPSGTVTFLFSDIEGSTRLLQELGERYPEVLEDHNRLVRAAFAENGGHEVGSQGDAFFFVFSSARNAVAAAVAAQKALGQHPWPDGTTVRVRIGLHTGEGTLAGDDYVGLDVHRAARIAAAGHGGQILVSQVTRVLVDGDLPESVSLIDLGPHRLKDLQKTEHIFQVVHPELTSRFPALRSLDISPHNLPVQITSFIGREEEMAEIRRLLADVHLVTLRGPGGAGKTRLAIQVAADHLDSFLDGVWLVELAPIADPANVPQTVASSLGLREPARAATEVLAEYLRTRSLLLVLDNCEQVLEATAALCAMLLRQCPNLRVLATSRETLGVTGERIFQVQPLALPDPGEAGSADMANQFAAVRLFVERAAGYQPGFKVTDDNIRAIVELCRRLDGIPLAIELAAARVRVLSVEQILARLEDRFRLLTGGPRTGLAHHQTLRAALDWGYDLLTDNERAMFRRVAVFAGGFTLEAAEGVCAGGVIDAGEVLDLLARLVDKSLVTVEQISAEVRYRLLETIRQYGLERLRDAGEEAAVRERHRAHFLELAEEAEMELLGPDQKTWLDRLETDHDNLRAALEWSRSSPDRIEVGLRLAGSLTHFWEVRGYWEEGRRWLDDLLPRTDPSPSLARVKAMTAAAGLALKDGDMPRVEALANESLALSRQLGDKRGAASCLVILGVRACRLEDYGAAEALGGEGLTLSRETGDNFATAWAQAVLGLVARARGDLDRADGLLMESLKALRMIGHRWASAIVLGNLGMIARDRGELDRAVAHLEEALEILRQLGDKSYASYTLLNLGTIASARHDYERAGRLYRECLGLRKELQETRGIVTCLAALGCTAAGLMDYRKAAVLFGAYDAQREATGASIPPIFRNEYERQVGAVTAALGPAAFAEAWAEGRALSRDDAIDNALKEPSRV